MDIKNSHSKLDNLIYTELLMQPYMSSKCIFKNDAQLLFKLRTRMADFKANFRNGNEDLKCILDCPEEDRQDHVLICDTIVENIPQANTVSYKSIFSKNTPEIMDTLKVIKEALHFRESYSYSSRD